MDDILESDSEPEADVPLVCSNKTHSDEELMTLSAEEEEEDLDNVPNKKKFKLGISTTPSSNAVDHPPVMVKKKAVSSMKASPVKRSLPSPKKTRQSKPPPSTKPEPPPLPQIFLQSRFVLVQSQYLESTSILHFQTELEKRGAIDVRISKDGVKEFAPSKQSLKDNMKDLTSSKQSLKDLHTHTIIVHERDTRDFSQFKSVVLLDWVVACLNENKCVERTKNHVWKKKELHSSASSEEALEKATSNPYGRIVDARFQNRLETFSNPVQYSHTGSIVDQFPEESRSAFLAHELGEAKEEELEQDLIAPVVENQGLSEAENTHNKHILDLGLQNVRNTPKYRRHSRGMGVFMYQKVCPSANKGMGQGGKKKNVLICDLLDE